MNMLLWRELWCRQTDLLTKLSICISKFNKDRHPVVCADLKLLLFHRAPTACHVTCTDKHMCVCVMWHYVTHTYTIVVNSKCTSTHHPTPCLFKNSKLLHNGPCMFISRINNQSINQYLFIKMVDRMEPQTVRVYNNRMSAQICSINIEYCTRL